MVIDIRNTERMIGMLQFYTQAYGLGFGLHSRVSNQRIKSDHVTEFLLSMKIMIDYLPLAPSGMDLNVYTRKIYIQMCVFVSKND